MINISTRKNLWGIGFVLVALYAILYVGHIFMPVMIDWSIFSQVSQAWKSPYSILGFVSPPYITAFLLYAWLPLSWSNSINIMLSVIVLGAANYKYKGGWFGLVLIFTSFQFLQLVGKNNIDWIPLLGVMSSPSLGLIMLSIKPQTLAGIGLIWLKKHGIKIFIPIIAVVMISSLIWHGWIFQWLSLTSHMKSVFWNASLFPWLIPLGAYMLYKAWKTDDEILAAMSTACFAPYFGIYSLAPVMAIAGKKYRWVVITLWVIGWICVFTHIGH